jgi:superfamily II DNA or RNA helicase
MDQWKERMKEFLPGVRMGLAQQNVCDYTGKHVVMAMVHSLAEENRYPESFYNWPGLIITDECHRIGARTWSPVPSMFPARYRIGVSATPRRKDGAENVFYYHMGRVLFEATEQRMVPKVRRVWSNFRFAKTQNFNPNVISRSILVNILCKSKARNRLIVEQLALAVKAGRKVLVLSERLEHLSTMEELLLKEEWSSPPSTGYYVGGMTKEQREDAETKQVIFATSQYASEGMDIPPLDTLVITTPQSDVEQSVGRILRPYPGKKPPVVVDIRDDKVGRFANAGRSRDRYYLTLGVE